MIHFLGIGVFGRCAMFQHSRNTCFSKFNKVFQMDDAKGSDGEPALLFKHLFSQIYFTFELLSAKIIQREDSVIEPGG
jgi:hypothetical protein